MKKFWRQNKWLIAGVVAFAVVTVVGQGRQRDKVNAAAVSEGRVPAVTLEKSAGRSWANARK